MVKKKQPKVPNRGDLFDSANHEMAKAQNRTAPKKDKEYYNC